MEKKHIPKLLYKEVKTDLDRLLIKYQSDINNNIDFDNWDWVARAYKKNFFYE